MKKSLILFVLTCSSIVGFAQSKQPKFSFVKETINMGNIPQGVPATTVFEFKNEGKEP